MAQYEINIDYNDEPYETNQTLEQLIARNLPAGASLVSINANEHQPNDVTLIVAADENDAKTISDLAFYAGYDDSDELNEYARVN